MERRPSPTPERPGATAFLRDLPWLAALVLLPILVHLPVATGVQALYFNDVTELHVPLRAFFGAAWAEGRFPLWAADVYLGFPLFAEGQAGPLYPPNWALFGTLPTWWAYGLSFVLHLSFAAAGTWAFLRRFVGRPAAFAGAAAFSLCGFLAMHHMHLNLVQATAWVPWGLFAVERLFDRGRLRDLVALALAGGLMALCGHPQSTLQGLGTFCLWAAIRALGGASWSGGRARERVVAVAAVVAAAGVACGLWMVHVLPGLQLAAQSVRGGASSLAQMGQHQTVQSLATMVLPSAFGTVGNDTAWLFPGGSYRQSPELFLGAAGVLLAALALAIRRDRLTLALAVAGLVVTLVVFGPLTEGVPAFFRLPFLRSLRFPDRLDAELSLFAAFLAAAGLDAVTSGAARARHAIAAAAAVALATGTIVGITYVDGLDRDGLLFRELVRDGALAAVALAVAVVGVARMRRHAAIGTALVLAAVVLPLADFGARQVPATDPSFWDEPATAAAIRRAACGDRPCPREDRLGRVAFHDPPAPYLDGGWLRANLPPAPLEGLAYNLPMLYGLPAVDGILPLRQAGFLDVYKPLHDKAGRSLGALGARFTVAPDRTHVPGGARALDVAGPVKVFDDPAALPRAFAVHRVEVIEDPGQAATRVTTSATLARAAILPSLPPVALAVPPAGTSSTVDVEAYEDERVALRARMAADGLVVLLDAFAPGWTATVDGFEAPMLRANRLFRAVPVPAGEHAVEFTYRPGTVFLGGALSLATLALLLALLAVEAFAAARRGRVPTPLAAPAVADPTGSARDRLVLGGTVLALVGWEILSAVLRWQLWRAAWWRHAG